MPDAKTFNRDEVIRHLLYRIRKLEKVLDASLAVRESGNMGRGKEVNGAQTVLVNHKQWVDLVEASRDAEESV